MCPFLNEISTRNQIDAGMTFIRFVNAAFIAVDQRIEYQKAMEKL